ncbi:hypothetical protein M9Y10_032171 [Tritrichomonas musculus]|uniref:Uncharacterized protein n=1 Tax=Tritrichomonas musculus TaxID=1915356 RepID=A0ABR2GZ70_9EUKA
MELEGPIVEFLKYYIAERRNPSPDKHLNIYEMTATKEQFDEFFDAYGYTYEKKNGLILSKADRDKQKANQQKLKEDELRESMKAEGCELISAYTIATADIYYTYEGREYKTKPTKWNSGHRAHKMQCIRYTPNYVKKVFADAGCELVTEYKNSKQKLNYKYNGNTFTTTFNDWIWYENRPHLSKKRTHFTES